MNQFLAAIPFHQNALEPVPLQRLVRNCCDCFDGDPAEPESKLPQWLFSVSEWLTGDLAELMALFVTLFQEHPLEYGQKVCSAVGFWIRHFPVHFDANPQLCRLLERLKRLAAADESIPRPSLDELDTSAIPSYAWLRNPSTRNPVSRHVSLLCEQWTAEDIAYSLSHIDHKALSRVCVVELKGYVRLGRLSSQTPHLERSITIFNCVSGFVQATILGKSSAAERAEVIQKFVQVGKHLLRLNNFNTLMAVIGGITHSNISRLAQTHSLLPLETGGQLKEFSQLLSFNNNYAKYRRALREVGHRFRIPIMGVHLKDLIAFWHSAGLENFERNRQISEKGVAQLAFLLSHFLSVDRTPPNFGDPNVDLINTIKVLLDIVYDEQELYKLSLKREPKEGMVDQPAACLPPAVFADWAEGVRREPDPNSVEKHIKQMVDAIFKHYDDDKDGRIGRAQFEQFIGNFSFLEPAVEQIGCDQNGQISRREMQEYFATKMRNSGGGGLGGGGGAVLHRWTEWHFLAPAICSNCSKLLWMRHGHRCARCAMATHHNCKPTGGPPSLCRASQMDNPPLPPLPSFAVGPSSASSSSASSGLGAWLNASLSPRFTAFGPSTSRSPVIHQHFGAANGRAQPRPVDEGGAMNNNRNALKGLRRVRTSSSSTSEGSSSTARGPEMAPPPPTAPQSARDHFGGVFRSSFHRFLRRTTAGGQQEGTGKSRTSSESTATTGENSKSAKCLERLLKEEEGATMATIEPRASLASEEVFEEETATEQDEEEGGGGRKMEERKGKG